MNRGTSGSHHETSDGAGWNHWLACHKSKLLFFAQQQPCCKADAHDLVQGHRGRLARPSRWGANPAPAPVFRLIRCPAIDLARRNHHRQNQEATFPAEACREWIVPEVADRESAWLRRAASVNLPEPQRGVLPQKLRGGLTFARMATTLDISANTATSRDR